ncbi:MAG: hydroxyacylglutathione hydrolase [Pseudomonadota bacterium]|nr:hydroxyacylglutathione hydrolase [Pseudomonadota bacterium]
MLNITPIPAFSDNYIWMLQRSGSSAVVLVDPGETRRILRQVDEQGIRPVALLITHHHADHAGGIAQLLERFPALEVYGPASENIAGVTHPVRQDDRIDIAEMNISFQILDVPGHTRGHVAYYGEGVLFCGDTVFACGCGRLFEGTPEQMTESLEKIAALPAATKLYCAHEYTLSNIGFARWVEPDNENLLQRDDDDMARQEKGIPTVPSTLDLELKTNPFLRYRVPAVKQAAEEFAGKKLNSDAEVFAAIRRWKDTEYD